MQRGEVRWYTFARPDKRRPVVILTRNTVLAYLGEVTVAPLTSVMRDIPSAVFLAPLDGMHVLSHRGCDMAVLRVGETENRLDFP